MKICFSIVSLVFLFLIFSNLSYCVPNAQKTIVYQDSLKLQTKLFKENAHASYYSNKFNGRKTASGAIFDNKKLTAAHKTLKFGTKLKVTNVVNDKFVTVVVNDIGPVSKARELDLSRNAFMEITDNKNLGNLTVCIEIIIE